MITIVSISNILLPIILDFVNWVIRGLAVYGVLAAMSFVEKDKSRIDIPDDESETMPPNEVISSEYFDDTPPIIAHPVDNVIVAVEVSAEIPPSTLISRLNFVNMSSLSRMAAEFEYETYSPPSSNETSRRSSISSSVSSTDISNLVNSNLDASFTNDLTVPNQSIDAQSRQTEQVEGNPSEVVQNEVVHSAPDNIDLETSESELAVDREICLIDMEGNDGYDETEGESRPFVEVKSSTRRISVYERNLLRQRSLNSQRSRSVSNAIDSQ